MNRPNSDINLDGQNRHFTSYTGGSNLTESTIGAAVTNIASKAVGYGSDGDDLTGKFMQINREGDLVTIQDQGYVELSYSGVSPAINDRVCVDGAGSVRTTAVGHTGGRPKIVDIAQFASTGNVIILLE